jgi:putative transposase
VVERAVSAELTDHLGYELGEEPAEGQPNRCKGSSSKSLITDHGPVEVELPRDREGSFEPQIVAKHQRRFAGFDDKIISMYARGMSTREISKHLEEIYGVEVGRDTIGRVTDAILDDVKEWQAWPLEKLYLVVWLDAIVLKIRDQGSVRNKHAYLAIAVGIEGIKETLGIWLEPKEGAKFWLRVISELKARGVEDILVFSVDRLKGFPEAIEAVYPQAIVQTCIVHMIRNSLRFNQLQGPQAARERPPDDLHRRDRRSCSARPRDVRWNLGQPLSADQPIVAGRLGAGHPLLRVSAAAAARGLHDQPDREPQQRRPQSRPQPRPLPRRRVRA